jgi:hypothetical protein
MMNRRQILWVAGVALALIAAGLTWRATRPRVSEEDRVREVIRGVVEGVQRKNMHDLMSPISQHYRDRSGYVRPDVHRLALAAFQEKGSYQVTVTRLDTVVQGDRARTELDADVYLTQDDGTQNVFSGTVQVDLRKEGRRWKIVSAEGWQEAGFEE